MSRCALLFCCTLFLAALTLTQQVFLSQKFNFVSYLICRKLSALGDEEDDVCIVEASKVFHELSKCAKDT
jgi:hypothetical protein